MKHALPLTLLLAAATLALGACDKQPVVVNVPAAPGPAGPTGATGQSGATGATGTQGEAGKPGEGTTVIVVPPAASAPSN